MIIIRNPPQNGGARVWLQNRKKTKSLENFRRGRSGSFPLNPRKRLK